MLRLSMKDFIIAMPEKKKSKQNKNKQTKNKKSLKGFEPITLLAAV